MIGSLIGSVIGVGIKPQKFNFEFRGQVDERIGSFGRNNNNVYEIWKNVLYFRAYNFLQILSLFF